MTNARRFSAPAVGIAVALFGCSKSNERIATFPASGSLFVGGQPAVGANVQLGSKDNEQLNKLAPHGIVETDGTFRLTTFTTGDGAPAGHYVLTVRWPGKPKPGHEIGPDRLQGRYADPSRPAREVEIIPGSNELGRIELK